MTTHDQYINISNNLGSMYEYEQEIYINQNNIVDVLDTTKGTNADNLNINPIIKNAESSKDLTYNTYISNPLELLDLTRKNNLMMLNEYDYDLIDDFLWYNSLKVYQSYADLSNMLNEPKHKITDRNIYYPVDFSVWVSIYGDDNAEGDYTNPLKTFDGAKDKVQQLRLEGVTGEITVGFLDGTYYLDNTLTFDSTDSGSEESPTIYTSYPGANVIISGGEELNLSWAQYSGRIYKASTSKYFRQLYVNGARAQKARSIKKSMMFWEPLIPGGTPCGLTGPASTGRLVVPKVDVDGLDLSLGEVGIYRKFPFSLCRIKTITADVRQADLDMAAPGTLAADYVAITFKDEEAGIIIAQAKRYSRDWYFLSNSLDLLTNPGDWFLDTVNDDLYYYLRVGEDINSSEFIIPSLEQLIKIDGTVGGDNPEYIVFKDLKFQHAKWDWPGLHGYIGGQGGFYEKIAGGFQTNVYMPQPGFYIKTANNITIDSCEFSHFGGNGISIDEGSEYIKIVDSEIYDISGNALNFYDYISRRASVGPWYPVKYCSLQNSIIHDTGVEFLNSHSVFLIHTQWSTIEHNEIYNTPYDALVINWRWYNYSSDSIIRYNDIHNFNAELAEGGGIATYNKNFRTVLSENYIHDLVPPTVSLYGGATTVAGIFYDDNSEGFYTLHNVSTVPYSSIAGYHKTYPFWACAWPIYGCASNYSFAYGHEDIIENAGPI